MNRMEKLEITILKNEVIAEKLIRENRLNEAEKLLRKNVDLKSRSYRTYDLLLKIYRAGDSYNEIIKILNTAIKNSREKGRTYRELRKVTILNELVENISKR